MSDKNSGVDVALKRRINRGDALMTKFTDMSRQELMQEHELLISRYNTYKDMGLKLDMSRGKPCKEQLDLINGMFDESVLHGDYNCENGTDSRNYGIIDGIPELKRIFAELLDISENELIVSGNSSLNIMHDMISRALLLGVAQNDRPWKEYSSVKFICPSPGYDRHFAICGLYGIKMLPVKMNPDGPDMDAVEKLAVEDASVKGIWCVPQYSNPEGITYSNRVVERLAKMETKANDFRIFWDNAYFVHDLYEEKKERVMNIIKECKAAGNPDRPYVFASTSKITFPGAGVSVIASSKANIDYAKDQIKIQTIGPDKINQLRHARFLKSAQDIYELMRRHAEIIRPKFEAVNAVLTEELAGKGIASWTTPAGGYFMSFSTVEGCAKRIETLAKEAGLVLTPAGATYPYGIDPNDNNIRISPTVPPLDSLKLSMHLFCVCVQIAAAEKLMK